ncbi:unnamed protein product [Didymodactylos carnosus]|uniref:F-box domain-containing protein n=1 Tax=Didymodactylos carnosus TaxID=1234261 RepID=A0A816CPG8_9BILA|nr:unnamed protein product [Didymodactylos carnosus]CAF4519896.1 unnamed protein product [Didymodactylos carnosus]
MQQGLIQERVTQQQLTIEVLSDELFIEIFQYVQVVDLFRGFYNLNSRLNAILMDQHLYLSVNLFEMTSTDAKFAEENDLLNFLRKKIIYLKTDDWYSLMLTNRRQSCSYWKRAELLSKKNINSYPSLRSLTIVRPDNMHYQQLIDLPEEIRQQIICLKLNRQAESGFPIQRVRRFVFRDMFDKN